MKRLYMVHCGYYDPSVGQGLFENHTNFFVCAEDFEDARAQARENAEFKRLNALRQQEFSETVAAYQARVEHVQGREVAEVEAAVDPERIGGVGQARWQPPGAGDSRCSRWRSRPGRSCCRRRSPRRCLA